MRINRHLLKEGQLYTESVNGNIVKLLHVFRTNKGLMFTTEIVESKNKDSIGKWSQALKKDLKLFK